MIDDLLQKYDFTGYSRARVIELLGPPLDRPADDAGFPQWDMVYLIGRESDGPLAIDDKALGFRFSDTGVVVGYGLSVN